MRKDLRALTYHRDVADWLEQEEPNGWTTVRTLLKAAPTGTTGWDDDEPAIDPAAELLRSAYRLEAEGHQVVHAALARAVENLGIDRPGKTRDRLSAYCRNCGMDSDWLSEFASV